ncbi:MAG: hypothetical protein PHP04_07675 [Bacteroidales bacterium]|nr:hypothetical protein [Bacteroidales bacterium]
MAAIIPTVQGQSVKGPYNKYEKGDYIDAEEGFRKVLLEYPKDVIANLGLGMIYANNSIQLIPSMIDKYDIFQAFRHIRQSKKQLTILRGGEIDQLNKLIKSLPDVEIKVNQEYNRIEDKVFNSLMKSRNLDSAIIFINEFPDSRYFKQVLQVRDNMYFNKVKGTSDVNLLNDFIERCPFADSIKKAIDLRNLAAYYALTGTSRNLVAVYDYLDRYPNSRQYAMVIQIRDSLESEKAIKENTVESYAFFFRSFPNAIQTRKMMDRFIELSFHRARKENTLTGYNEFLDLFPLSKHYAQSIRYNRDSLMFSLHSGTVDSLNKYITNFPSSRYFNQAVKLRNKIAFENALKDYDISALEQFIYRYPASDELQMACSMRDSLVLVQVQFLSSEKDFSELLVDYPYLINQPRTMAVLEEVLYKEAKKMDLQEYYQEFLERCPRSKHTLEIQAIIDKKNKEATDRN